MTPEPFDQARQPQAVADPDPIPEAGAAPVVIYRSGITDARPVTRWLAERGVGYREIVMGMGDARMRERFHRLARATGWSTLPQIFMGGRFVGGLDEFFAHPAVAATAARPAPRVAMALGYLGLVPFAAGAIALWTDAGPAGLAERLLVGYGAVILTFLGAVHWGRELAAPRRGAPALVAGVAPALVGWATLALPVLAALVVQALAFACVLALDARWLRDDTDYLRLRARLTTVVITLLAAASIAVMP